MRDNALAVLADMASSLSEQSATGDCLVGLPPPPPRPPSLPPTQSKVSSKMIEEWKITVAQKALSTQVIFFTFSQWRVQTVNS